MNTSTLYEYYKQKGQKLPSVSERAPLFEKYGLGKTSEYTGTKQQNIDLLNKLQISSEPITSSQGKSPTVLANEIDAQIGNIPLEKKAFGESETERIKKRMEVIKTKFGIDEKPIRPIGEIDGTKLTTAQNERDIVAKRGEEIMAEKLKLQEDWRKFKQISGEGVSEFGRERIETEEGRKIQNRLDALNREELVLETKFRNRNSVISELMQIQRQNYQDAVRQYNIRFNQAIQLYNIFDKEDDEIKTNAKASLDILSKTYEAQIKAGQLNIDQITGIREAQLEEYETQAGRPLGSTIALLKILKPNEKKIAEKFNDKTGVFSAIYEDANGDLKIKSIKSEELKKSIGIPPVIYTDKTLPGTIRQDIISTLTDKEGAKKLGRKLKLTDLMTMFPEVDRKTLQSYYNDYYDYETLTAEEEKTTKPWWKFW